MIGRSVFSHIASGSRRIKIWNVQRLGRRVTGAFNIIIYFGLDFKMLK